MPLKTTWNLWSTTSGGKNASFNWCIGGTNCTETLEANLYGQLEEGLQFKLIKSPAVSGAQNYKELYVAAKSKEKHIAELERCQTI